MAPITEIKGINQTFQIQKGLRRKEAIQWFQQKKNEGFICKKPKRKFNTLLNMLHGKYFCQPTAISVMFFVLSNVEKALKTLYWKINFNEIGSFQTSMKFQIKIQFLSWFLKKNNWNHHSWYYVLISWERFNLIEKFLFILNFLHIQFHVGIHKFDRRKNAAIGIGEEIKIRIYIDEFFSWEIYLTIISEKYWTWKICGHYVFNKFILYMLF